MVFVLMVCALYPYLPSINPNGLFSSCQTRE